MRETFCRYNKKQIVMTHITITTICSLLTIFPKKTKKKTRKNSALALLLIPVYISCTFKTTYS